MADTWRTLLEAATAGKAVFVNLSPGAELKRPKRRRGRPRVRGAAPFGHYAAYMPHRGGRPRCLAPGCGVRLKRDQGPLGCSPAHQHKVIEHARAVLALAEKFGLGDHAKPK